MEPGGWTPATETGERESVSPSRFILLKGGLVGGPKTSFVVVIHQGRRLNPIGDHDGLHSLPHLRLCCSHLQGVPQIKLIFSTAFLLYSGLEGSVFLIV